MNSRGGVARSIATILFAIVCMHAFGPDPGGGGVTAMRVTERAKQFVCTETFKAGLTSFFIQRDTKAAFAEDQSELCEMCAKVMRLAYLYTNDVQTSEKWASALETNACQYVSPPRRGDCQGLAKGIIASQRSFFSSKQSKFAPADLKGSTEQLGLVVDARSYKQCKAIGCCPVVPKPKGKPLLEPCSKPGDAKDVDRDRAALQTDRFALDSVRDQLFAQRRANNEFKAKLDLKEEDLKGRELKLKKNQDILKRDQQKMREAMDALQRRENRVKRREDDERALEMYNKKKEKWLKEREENVKDREDICYKREDQLGIPHPPKTRPPPPPSPPEKPATSRPTS